jgi:lipooligosaccharide transport system permease protein
LFAALAPAMSALSLVFTLVATPLYFFCGAFFPIDVLPDPLQPVAWAAPLTSGVHLARGFAGGVLGRTHVWATLYLVGLIVVLYPLVEALLRRRLIK